ncbi:ATP-binding cassette domain-containing protein [Sulfurimonas sp. MAG313]|nr:ATP-binding cassette domain-containing protein [Sulfurimonas sp. MAG313]MDF1880235.1 ATP-binding cassette domain-containing protein [Sulfurimonas sp. MAG313]
MVSVNNLIMRFGSRVLFDNVNLKLDQHKRYGLIGANGAGKTTFLKILSGEIDEFEGDISIGSGLKVGVLGQNQFAFEDFTVMDAVLFGNKRLYDATKEKEELYVTGDFDSDETNNRLAELETICVEEDPTYEYDVHITKMLENLGISSDIHNDLMSTVESSTKIKVLLAQVLFPKPEVLFLDEPTNNLDIDTIGWLENELKRHEGTLVVISHDRHFINSVVTHILDVDFQKIRQFTGNYDEWYIASTVMMKQLETDKNKAEKEKAELEAFVRRFSANASKAKQASSRQKQLDKINVEDIKPSSRRDPSIVFKAKRSMGGEALEVLDISHDYGAGEGPLLGGLNLRFEPNEKVAIIGTNGIGKTTLLKIIMEEMKPTSGTVNWGATIEPSYFPQDTVETITGEGTLYDWLRAFDPKREIAEIRNCLGRMLFNGEQQEKSVEKISGGEKHRMMLSKMMLEEGNFLVLDEPTNHLDLEAIIALGEGLRDFGGNVICASHDRELLDAFASRIIRLEKDGSVTDFKGTYEEFAEVHGH